MGTGIGIASLKVETVRGREGKVMKDWGFGEDTLP